MQMDIMKREQQEGIRINKYLSEAGICSRRAADREIENGNVDVYKRQLQVCRALSGGKGDAYVSDYETNLPDYTE